MSAPEIKGAAVSYCAQCSLNGAGQFPLRADGYCPNAACVLYRHGYCARPADLETEASAGACRAGGRGGRG